MCGIAGFVSTRPLLGLTQLITMGNALIHRGPDDAGARLWDAKGGTPGEGMAGTIGLAHRRLSILDLSANGHQPMSNEDGTVWIAYNGEFYNFGDYRQELAAHHDIRSRSDTEIIIHLYEEHGIEKTLARMNGMFALALWDQRRKILCLARDRLGKKPLYYVLRPDGGLVFASEIKALMAGGFVDTSRIDPVALVQLWTYGYVTGERTFYRDVHRLLPGHYAEWKAGSLTTREYWDCPFDPQSVFDRPLDKLADELEALLCDAIRLRLISDVPLGLFLSGGIDSSLMAALAARVAGNDIQSFTIAFKEQAMNEAPFATAIAKHLGIPNTVLTVADDMRGDFEAIARQFDEPFGDSSSIPTYYVSKLAREHVTVALTGDAGDELFAGYDSYAKALWLWGDSRQRRLFGRRRPLLQRIIEGHKRFIRRQDRLTSMDMFNTRAALKGILSDRVWHDLDGINPFEDRERWYTRAERADLLSQLQYMNIKTYLPDDILVKVDRMSMAHALECRSPFLDYRVVEFAARLPYGAKISADGCQKFILRRLLARYVPEVLFDRPKMGFSVPWAEWCRGPLGGQLRERWRTQTGDYLNPAAAERLFPRGRQGWTSLQWNAFVSLLFLDPKIPAWPRN